MPNRQAFGRRINPQAAVQPPALRADSAPISAPAEIASPPPDTAEDKPLDAELDAWRQARGSKVRIPWSQLSLMASLCFGIASFVLPDSVNSSVDWLLWGLAIMSFYVWFSNRRRKKLTSLAAP